MQFLNPKHSHFQAVLGGRVVSYPQAATFAIERRDSGKKYSLLATKDSIEGAIGKMSRAAKPGTTTRLSYIEDGRFHPMLTEVHT